MSSRCPPPIRRSIQPWSMVFAPHPYSIVCDFTLIVCASPRQWDLNDLAVFASFGRGPHLISGLAAEEAGAADNTIDAVMGMTPHHQRQIVAQQMVFQARGETRRERIVDKSFTYGESNRCMVRHQDRIAIELTI